MKADCQFKQLARKHRIIFICYRITCQKCMNSEMLHSLTHQNPVCIKKLFLCHSIFGIARIVHDSVTHLKQSARIESAGNGLRQFADRLLQKINMCNIIQINGRADFICIAILFCRSIIGRKHDLTSGCADCLTEHQFRNGRAVKPASFLHQQLHDHRIRSCLYRKIFAKSSVP